MTIDRTLTITFENGDIFVIFDRLMAMGEY